jgi:glutathione synthetase
MKEMPVSGMGKLSPLAHKIPGLERSSQKMRYPPEFSEEQASSVISDIKDYQLTHGSLLKLVQTDEDSTVLAHPVGASVFPTLFPRHLFHEALELQGVYNRLYATVAEDEQWLYETLEGLIGIDPLARCLWGIYEEVRREGYVQDFSLGVWRNDYMLHMSPSSSKRAIQEPVLKQVEFNTIAVAGGTHGNRISDMHQHLQQTDAYQSSPEDQNLKIIASALPPNHTITTITTGLITAHKAYGSPQVPGVKQTCILFIVQPHNFNIADERPLEYSLWQSSPPIPAYRLCFGADVLEHTILSPNRELLYHPPSRPGLSMEVSVVYFRSAFEAHEYHHVGRMARLHLERSRAIKCPNLLGHLCTFKKVQQALSMPGALSRFLSPDEVDKVSATFAPMYALDESESGLKAREIVRDEKKAKDYVLKPSLEGGGHNVYGSDIPKFLAGVTKETWSSYVLMGKIVPPVLQNVLMSQRGMYEGPVISELGIFGVCLWKRKAGNGDGERVMAEIVEELKPSWSFKTKDASVDEMSVVKGYGCFDSPLLVERETFTTCCQ